MPDRHCFTAIELASSADGTRRALSNRRISQKTAARRPEIDDHGRLIDPLGRASPLHANRIAHHRPGFTTNGIGRYSDILVPFRTIDDGKTLTLLPLGARVWIPSRATVENCGTM
jgi:hypothetical protein